MAKFVLAHGFVHATGITIVQVTRNSRASDECERNQHKRLSSRHRRSEQPGSDLPEEWSFRPLSGRL